MPGNQLYSDELYGSAALRLIYQTDSHIQTVCEIPIQGSKQIAIEFSDDGKYLGILLKLKHQLTIYMIEDSNIARFFERLKNGEKKPIK